MVDMMNEETRACAIVDKVTSPKFKRPSIKTPCVADRYHSTGQRIAEFSASASIANALPGGLLSVTELADGHLQANLYRLERTHVFVEGYPVRSREMHAAACTMLAALKGSLDILDQLRNAGHPVQVEQAEARAAIAAAEAAGITTA